MPSPLVGLRSWPYPVSPPSIKIIGQAEVMVVEFWPLPRVARSGLNVLIPFVERAPFDVRYLSRMSGVSGLRLFRRRELISVSKF
jgi:hypothetical protein